MLKVVIRTDANVIIQLVLQGLQSHLRSDTRPHASFLRGRQDDASSVPAFFFSNTAHFAVPHQ
ncbi:hypothetical protein E2C01_065934 [Portunus trituberculatus]|uniref:Uncharacterized protein n=1 Tax=Portunus trituberculatus TaxID=210409 RepID=A0A5B7HPM8_PORTR|nr:hypothetical protein [Portunus trituberculatus]